MARMISSGSSSLRRSSSFSRRRRSSSSWCSVMRSFPAFAGVPCGRRSLAWSQVEADEHSLLVREVTDDLAERLRHTAHERRDREDLIVARELRVLEEVYDLDAI